MTRWHESDDGESWFYIPEHPDAPPSGPPGPEWLDLGYTTEVDVAEPRAAQVGKQACDELDRIVAATRAHLQGTVDERTRTARPAFFKANPTEDRS